MQRFSDIAQKLTYCLSIGLATPGFAAEHFCSNVEGYLQRVPHGRIAQWLERLTADQQVPGSNPGVPL